MSGRRSYRHVNREGSLDQAWRSANPFPSPGIEGFFQAAEGARTLDLLHGKQVGPRARSSFLPANHELWIWTQSEAHLPGCAQIRPRSAGFSESIRNIAA